MSSKRRVRRKQCSGKVRHSDIRAAKRALFLLTRSKGYTGHMNTYRCRFCGGYHIGHHS